MVPDSLGSKSSSENAYRPSESVLCSPLKDETCSRTIAFSRRRLAPPSKTCPLTETIVGCLGCGGWTVNFCSITKIKTAASTVPMMPNAHVLSELSDDAEGISPPPKLSDFTERNITGKDTQFT